MTICYIATYLRNGLLESIQKDPNYDARNLLTTKIKKWLKKTYSSKELKEFKEDLTKIIHIVRMVDTIHCAEFIGGSEQRINRLRVQLCSLIT